MAIREPNHICKNAHCPNGIDGEPKHYYACNYCDRSNQWRSVACSIECYEAYIQQVIEAREKNKVVDTMPIRTDITSDEQQELMSTPIQTVLDDTKKDLKDYTTNENGEVVASIAEAITQINDEIDSEVKNTVVSNINTTTKSYSSFSKANKKNKKQ